MGTVTRKLKELYALTSGSGDSCAERIEETLGFFRWPVPGLLACIQSDKIPLHLQIHPFMERFDIADAVRTDNVYTAFADEDLSVCGDSITDFMNIKDGRTKIYGDCIRVYVKHLDGYGLTGLMKKKDNALFWSFITVRDSTGRYPLVRGQFYQLVPALDAGSYPGKWASCYMDSLGVHPRSIPHRDMVDHAKLNSRIRYIIDKINIKRSIDHS